VSALQASVSAILHKALESCCCEVENGSDLPLLLASEAEEAVDIFDLWDAWTAVRDCPSMERAIDNINALKSCYCEYMSDAYKKFFAHDRNITDAYLSFHFGACETTITLRLETFSYSKTFARIGSENHLCLIQ
jgi:hypothetical protein